MFEEELEAVTAFDIVDEEDAFAFNELKLEDDVGKEEFVHFGTSRDGESGMISQMLLNRQTHLTAYWLRCAVSSSSSSSLRMAWEQDETKC